MSLKLEGILDIFYEIKYHIYALRSDPCKL